MRTLMGILACFTSPCLAQSDTPSPPSSLGDIAKQLPDDSRRFAAVDRMYAGLMQVE